MLTLLLTTSSTRRELYTRHDTLQVHSPRKLTRPSNPLFPWFLPKPFHATQFRSHAKKTHRAEREQAAGQKSFLPERSALRQERTCTAQSSLARPSRRGETAFVGIRSRALGWAPACSVRRSVVAAAAVDIGGEEACLAGGGGRRRMMRLPARTAAAGAWGRASERRSDGSSGYW